MCLSKQHVFILLFIYFKNATRFKLLHVFNINTSTHFSKPASSHDAILRNVEKVKEKLFVCELPNFFFCVIKKRMAHKHILQLTKGI